MEVTMINIEEDEFEIIVTDHDIGKELYICNIKNESESAAKVLQAMTQAVEKWQDEGEEKGKHDLNKLRKICNQVIE